MRDPSRVHVPHTQHKLSEDLLALGDGHALLMQLFGMVEQRLPVTQLHHKVHMRSLINNLEEPHDVRMLHLRQNLYFCVHSVPSLGLYQIFLFVSLQSQNCLRFLMSATTHNCHSSLTNLQADLKVIKA
jgi:hypothetical protein